MGTTESKSPTGELSKWIAGRLLRALATCFLASILLFALVQALPGDAATNIAGKGGEELVAQTRAKMGLDQPAWQRYLTWLTGTFKGDFGTTLVTNKEVSSVIEVPIASTTAVAIIVMALLILITVPVAVWAGAKRKSKVSQALSATSVTLSAVPEFAVAIFVLAVLAHWTRLLPVLSTPGPGNSVWDNPICLVMPSLCLWLICSASIFRRIVALIDTYARAPFVREAELAGLSKPVVLLRHLLPSAIYGIGQLLAQTVPYLLGGAVVVETVTSFPGLGYTLVSSINQRESPTVMAIGLILMLTTVVAFTLADLLGKRQERIEAVV